MIDTTKVMEFFNASEKVRVPVHVVGCGAIGSHVCEQLTRLGMDEVHIWDFDKVEPKNITNQMFLAADIGLSKVDAAEKMMLSINPDMKIVKHPKGISAPYILNGYVFLCVDNISLRREIVKANMMNPNCVGFADFRMRLTDAQYYFARRDDPDQIKNLLASMDFTQEEAAEATPKSACGVELSVIYTVKMIVAYGMANFVKFFSKQKVSNIILCDANLMCVDAF